MIIKNIQQKIDYAVVLFFLVSLLCYMPTVRSSDTIVWFSALLLMFLRAAYIVVNKQAKLKIDSNVFWYIILVLWGLISCLWSKNTARFMDYFVGAFPIVLVSVLSISVYIGQRISVDHFNYLFIVAGIIAGIRYSLYTDWSVLQYGVTLRGKFGDLIDHVTNYNNYSALLFAVCVIALYYAIVKNNKMCYLASALLIVFVLMAGSRKNTMAIPIIAVWFAFFKRNGKKKLKTFLAVLLILFAAIAALFTVPALAQIKNETISMLEALFSDSGSNIDESTYLRKYLMNTAIDVWHQHFWVGVGWENFRFYNYLGLLAHNNYCEILASLGLVGFFIYYLKTIGVFIKSIIKSFKSLINEENALVSGFILSFLIVEYGNVNIYSRERMIVLLIILCWYNVTSKSKLHSSQQ